MKKVKFFTLGCKVNQYETQGMREQFLKAGVFKENNSDIADVYVINTCTVTNQADRQSRQFIRKAINAKPQAKIIVTGCYVEKDAQQIRQISDRIQIVPNQHKHRIVNFLNPSSGLQPVACNRIFVPLKISHFKDHERAFVKVQDGCNNFCAYCKVPIVRGRSRSRSVTDIIQEVVRLINNGFKEIVLTGICLGDYRFRNKRLTDLLLSLERIKGNFRLRLSSIEPQLIDDRLIDALSLSKICPHLHMPLQSGDEAILKRMNRHYTVKHFISLVSRIKKKIQNVGITTDILVGFPGEKKQHFRNSMRTLKEIIPLRTHIFSFSPRQGTAAFGFAERIDQQEVKERVRILRKLAEECSYKFRKRFLNKTLLVLIESQPDKESGCFCGYAENYIRVIVKNASKKDINNLLQVKVEAVDMRCTKARKS